MAAPYATESKNPLCMCVYRTEVEILDLDGTMEKSEIKEALKRHFGERPLGYVKVNMIRLIRTGYLKVG